LLLHRAEERAAAMLKYALLGGASALALAFGWRIAKKRRELRASVGAAVGLRQDEADVAEVTRDFLLYAVVPLWLAVGAADWACHRAARIEHSTGAKESLLHLAMMAEAGLPVLACLFLEITSPVLALVLVCFLLHEATALWDLEYASSRREIAPIEQHVHDYLVGVPLMAAAFVAVLHWPRLKALLGAAPGAASEDFEVRLRKGPPSKGYAGGLLVAIMLFEVLPYLEELGRGLAANGGRLAPRAGVSPTGAPAAP
jgi:hypothetical protein